MQKLSSCWIAEIQDIYKQIFVKLGSGPCDHCWIQEELILETGGRDREGKEQFFDL